MRRTPLETNPCNALASLLMAARKYELYSPMFLNFL